MTAYRSFGVALALAAACACSSSPPHPAGWTQGSGGEWTTTTGAGIERFSMTKTPTQGSLSDLASQQAVDTVEQVHGARLIGSVPFGLCPGEAGLATYSLPGRRTLEIAFSVSDGSAVVARYERPASLGASAAATQALRQAVCYVL